MYNALFLLITLHLLTSQASPLMESRLQNIEQSGNSIFTIEEAEELVNESQSYGTTCDSATSYSTGRLPVYASSLCPWYYELSHQPGLFPSHVLRAKLRCNKSENRSPCKMRNARDYTCVYIRRGIRMINETCQGQGCEFIRNVRIGAQCVHTQPTHGILLLFTWACRTHKRPACAVANTTLPATAIGTGTEAIINGKQQ